MAAIYYQNNNVAWNGTIAYHKTGNVAWTGTRAFYEYGNVAWNGSTAFLENGNAAGSDGIEVQLDSNVKMYVGKSGFKLYINGNQVV